MRPVKIGPAICLALIVAPVSAIAEPAALVLEVSGRVMPPVAAFDEVDAGTRLVLDPGSTLVLEHYAGCEAVIVTGGSVSVGFDGLGIDGGEIVERRPLECAAVVALAADTVTAGVVLRSLRNPAVSVALAPEIVIAGAPTDIDRLRIERDGQEIATLSVRSGRVDWPEGGLFLSDGARYRLVLLGEATVRQVEVVADRDGPERVVLRASPEE